MAHFYEAFTNKAEFIRMIFKGIMTKIKSDLSTEIVQNKGGVGLIILHRTFNLSSKNCYRLDSQCKHLGLKMTTQVWFLKYKLSS